MWKSQRIILTVIAVTAVFVLSFFLWISDKYTVPIMMYHSVNSVDNPEAPTVDPEMFDLQMEYLRHWKFNVLSLDELVEGIKSGRRFPRRSVAITFDDGFEDNYTHAYRTLKDYGFPATIFMPAGKIGTPGRLSAWQLKEMAANDITIGSHTYNETYLPDLSDAAQRYEIRASKRELERVLGRSVHYISYPIGGYSDAIKQLVVKADYKAAFATNRGYDRLNKDVFEVNRIRFGNADKTDMIMRVKLSGYYNLFRKGKAPF